MIIKVLLIGGLTLAAVQLIRGRRTALSMLMRRALTLLAIAAGIVAVVLPGLVTEVANAVGVGRGTDLVVYLLAVTFLFVSISLYLRLTEMTERMTVLTRQLALVEAESEATVEHHDDAPTPRTGQNS